MALDEENGEGLRIIFQYKDNKNQEFSAPEASTPGLVLDSTNRGNNPASEYFPSLLFGPKFMEISVPPPHQRRTLVTL